MLRADADCRRAGVSSPLFPNNGFKVTPFFSLGKKKLAIMMPVAIPGHFFDTAHTVASHRNLPFAITLME